MDIKAFMEDIDGVRAHEGVTVRALCEVAGITRKTYYAWMTGKSYPNLTVLAAVLEALNTELILLPRGAAKAKTLTDSEDALWNG